MSSQGYIAMRCPYHGHWETMCATAAHISRHAARAGGLQLQQPPAIDGLFLRFQDCVRVSSLAVD
jgi:hypothetical protein